MNVGDIHGLIKDIEFAFVLPFVGFVLAVINIRLTPRSRFNGLKLRLSLSFVLLLFASLFSVLMFQDRLVLTALWRCSPVGYSLLYSICALLIGAAIIGLITWKLRPERWKDSEG